MGGRGKYSISARMPRFRLATVPRAKIRDYLLSPKNPGGKAAFFKTLGYTTKNADRFKNDLLDGLKRNKAFVCTENRRGDVSMSVIIELGITKRTEVVTAWVIESGVPRIRGDDPRVVGFVVTRDGKQAPTRRFKIHYSKKGTHIVPYAEEGKPWIGTNSKR